MCAEVIRRFEGYIAQYLGDGLLIYFGYPQAHEDDGQRAVRAALGMVEAMERLNQCLVQTLKERLAGESYTLLECRCSAYHRNSPLYPVIDLYQRALQFRREDSPRPSSESWKRL